MELLQSFLDMSNKMKNSSHPTLTFPAEVEHGKALPLCFSSYSVNKGPLCSLFSAIFFTILCFLLLILLFKMVPTCAAEVLSSVRKHEKAVMCLMEKIHVFR